MLVNPVVCSHPENLLGIDFSITCFTPTTAAFHFGCIVSKARKINNLNESPGWIGFELVAELKVIGHPGSKRFG